MDPIIRDIILRVNGKEAEENLNRTKSRIDEIKARLKELNAIRANREFTEAEKQEYNDLNKELRKCVEEVRRFGSTSDEVARALDNLSGKSVNELRRNLKTLQKALNSGEVARGTKEWDVVADAVRRTKEELQKVNAETKVAKSSMGGIATFGAKWGGLGALYLGAANLYDRAVASMQQYIEAWSSVDAAMSNVEKYTGMAREEVEALNAELQKMDTTTSIEGLNALAADAGRLGITSRQQVLDFVQAADQINVALGEDLGEGAVKNIGKIAQLFGDADRLGLKQAMLSTGSVINELAQSSSASEGYLMEFTARLAGVGRQAGLTQAQVMGFASILDQGMVNVEKGATAMQNVITLLNSKTAELASVAGLDVKKFSELLKTDANEAVLTFVQALSDSGGFDQLAQKLTEMHMSGAGVTQTLSTLANNIDALRATQQQAAQAFTEGTSLTNEFDKANSTVEARLKKLREEAERNRAVIGQRLLPAYYSLIAGCNSLLSALGSLGTFFVQNSRAILSLVAVLTVYNVVSNIALIKTKLLTAATVVWHTVTGVATRVVATCKASVALLSLAFNTLRGNTVAAAAAQRALNASMLANPYAAVLTALVAIGAAIYLFATRTRSLNNEQRAALQLQKDNLAVQKKANEDIAQQQSRVRLLTAIIHDNNRSLQERQSAIRQLRAIVPGYNAEISRSGQITRENTAAVKEYIDNLRSMAAAQAAAQQITNIQGESNNYEMALEGWRNAVSLRKQRLEEYERQNKRILAAVKDLPKQYVYQLNGAEREVYLTHLRLRQSYEYSISRTKYYGDLLAQNSNRINRLTKIAAKNAAQAFDNSVTPVGEGSQTYTATSPTGGGAGPATSTDTDKNAEALREMEARYAAERAVQKAALAARLISQEKYNAKVIELQLQQLDEEALLYEEGSKEMTALQEKRADLQLKKQNEQQDFSLRDIERKEQEALDAAKQRYIQGITSADQYEQEQTFIKLEHLSRRLSLQEEYGNKEEADKLRRQIKSVKEEKELQERNDFWKKVYQFRSEYLKESDEQLLADKRAFAKKLLELGLITAEEYRTILEKLKEKPDAPDFGDGGEWATAFDRLFDNLTRLSQRIREGKADWTDYALTATAALSSVGTMSGSFSQYYRAQQDLEVAKVTESYDAKIKAAGNNTRRTKQLEEQKQKELAKIKNKYAKKQMQMEIAQAVATTAQNAISAFGSQLIKGQPWTLALAIAAAALATAQGAMQVAIIRKQHAAQAAGYYEGGFTGGNRYRRTAGVVHEGEFVANHFAVQNPALLPLLDLIDTAQRNGTVSSLTPADVSRAIAAPAFAASSTAALAARPYGAELPPIQLQAPAPTVVHETEETTRTLQRLADRLDLGIKATVAIEGPDGLDRQWSKYQKLKKNT